MMEKLVVKKMAKEKIWKLMMNESRFALPNLKET